MRRTRAERSFHIDGWVVLPDHLHCVLTLPPGDDDFSNRIKAIKIRFVRAVEPNERRSSVRIAEANGGYGNVVSGNTPFETKATIRATWTMYTTIQSNMALLRQWRNGSIRRFIDG